MRALNSQAQWERFQSQERERFFSSRTKQTGLTYGSNRDDVAAILLAGGSLNSSQETSWKDEARKKRNMLDFVYIPLQLARL